MVFWTPEALQVFDDHPGEVLGVQSVFAQGGGGIIRGQDAVRGQALDGERPGYTDALGFFVGLVVEEFGIGPPGDGGVDFLLAFAAQIASIPPAAVRLPKSRDLGGLHRAGFPIPPNPYLPPR